MRDVLIPVLNIFKIQIKKLDLKLVLTLNSYTKDPTILVDKIRVQQILSNLVQNAIKYTRKGGNIDVIVS